ncbi:MAG: O-antigen ligase family protein [Elusimicrobiaceae bacterium]|nr:O-antigen ligase family protein [Elusimicrobiaceae bacterium]
MLVFLRIIFILLTLFVPFAFAGAEPWAFSILQGGLVVIWLLYWISGPKVFLYTRLTQVACGAALFLLILSILQACLASNIFQPVPWHPISMMPLYSLEFASVFATYILAIVLVGVLFTQHKLIKLLLSLLVGVQLLVAFCAWGLPNGEYIFRLADVRGGIGPFLNRNHAAVFFAFGAILSLGLFFTSLLKKNTARYSPLSRITLSSWLWAGSFVFLTFSTIMTRSRGGMLALLTGIFLYAYLHFATLKRHPIRRRRGLIWTTVALLVAITLISTHIPQISAFAQRSEGTSTQVRQMLYQAAAEALQQYPIWGIGTGALPVVIPAYTAYPLDQYIERLHNDWLELLLSVGIVGTLPILLAIGWFILLALKRLRQLPPTKRPLFTACFTALGVMSVGSLVDFHFFIPANAFLFFICLGALTAPTYDKHQLYHLQLSRAVCIIMACLCIGIIYIPTCKTMAWRNVLFSYGLRVPGKLALYRQALSYYPSPRYAVRLGNACLNAAAQTADAPQRQALVQEANDVAIQFLRRYPKEPELSMLYLRAQNSQNSH